MPNVIQHTFKGTGVGDTPWSFSWCATLATGTALDDARDRAVDWWDTLMTFAGTSPFSSGAGPIFPSAVHASEVISKEIDLATGDTVNALAGTLTPNGSGGGTGLPPDCATVVSLRTETFTRSGRGRFYLPPFSSGQLENGRWYANVTAGLLSCLQGAYAAYLEGPGSTGAVVVWSRVNHTTYPVTSLAVGNHVDTQRRRDTPPETYAVGDVT